MNEFSKINEIMEILKSTEKTQIDQFKKQLEQQLSNNKNEESIDTNNDNNISDKLSNNSNKLSNKSDKETVLEHYNEKNSIESTEKISEEILNENNYININTQTEIIENENSNHIQNEIQNENNYINNINTQTEIIENENENHIQSEIQNEITNEIPNEKEHLVQCIKNDIGFVLFCFDHRFINNMHELLNRDQTVKSFDYFSLAGGSLGFLKDDLGCWDKTCIEHIELAQNVHNITKIVIIDHEDCEMYKNYYKDLTKHPKREKKHHINNLTELMEILEKQFKLTVDAYILNLDGTFIKI